MRSKSKQARPCCLTNTKHLLRLPQLHLSLLPLQPHPLLLPLLLLFLLLQASPSTPPCPA